MLRFLFTLLCFLHTLVADDTYNDDGCFASLRRRLCCKTVYVADTADNNGCFASFFRRSFCERNNVIVIKVTSPTQTSPIQKSTQLSPATSTHSLGLLSSVVNTPRNLTSLSNPPNNTPRSANQTSIGLITNKHGVELLSFVGDTPRDLTSISNSSRNNTPRSTNQTSSGVIANKHGVELLSSVGDTPRDLTSISNSPRNNTPRSTNQTSSGVKVVHSFVRPNEHKKIVPAPVVNIGVKSIHLSPNTSAHGRRLLSSADTPRSGITPRPRNTPRLSHRISSVEISIPDEDEKIKISPEKLKILVIDSKKSNYEVLALFCSSIEAENENIFWSPNGSKSIELFKKHKPHLIFVNLNTPATDKEQTVTINDLDIIKQIRNYQHEGGIMPVIVGLSKEFMSFGADTFFHIPSNPDSYSITRFQNTIRNFFNFQIAVPGFHFV